MIKKGNNEIPKSIKSYKIEKEEYKLWNMVLYSAINTDINEKVLIHIFPKEEIKTKINEVTFMNNHVFLMKLLNHKNILRLYEIIETKTHAFLIYEYFNGIKLSDYILKKKKLNEEETLKKVEGNIKNIDVGSRIKDKEIDSSKINQAHNMVTVKKLPKSNYGIVKKKDKNKTKAKNKLDDNDLSGSASGSGSGSESAGEDDNKEGSKES